MPRVMIDNELVETCPECGLPLSNRWECGQCTCRCPDADDLESQLLGAEMPDESSDRNGTS